jgi:hypothetical protein
MWNLFNKIANNSCYVVQNDGMVVNNELGRLRKDALTP